MYFARNVKKTIEYFLKIARKINIFFTISLSFCMIFYLLLFYIFCRYITVPFFKELGNDTCSAVTVIFFGNSYFFRKQL